MKKSYFGGISSTVSKTSINLVLLTFKTLGGFLDEIVFLLIKKKFHHQKTL